jgi:hypothetical protein
MGTAPGGGAFPRADLVPAFWHQRALELYQRLAEPSANWATGSAELLAPFVGKNTLALSRGRLLARLPRAWKALPRFGRLSLRIERLPGPMPRPLWIFETCAFPHKVTAPDWVGDKRSIRVGIRRIDVGLYPKPVVTDVFETVAAVSLHALARRFERGNDARPRLISVARR